MNVGERLRYLRKQRGLSQQDLCNIVGGINRSTYARYETNTNQADYETLIRLANYFHVSLDYIFGRVDYPVTFGNTSLESNFYIRQIKDLQAIILDRHALYLGDDELILDRDEKEEFLRHTRVAWSLIKERREEKERRKQRRLK